jgi:hypothetical protein
MQPGAGTPLINNIPQALVRDAQGFLDTLLQINPHYPFVTCEDYKYILCGMKKQGIKTYYDNVLKEDSTCLHFPRSKNGDGVQKLVASMPDDQALGVWRLHSLEDMTWNDNHRYPSKYCC